MKRSIFKKLTAVFLSASLLLGTSSITAFAANGPSDYQWHGYYFAGIYFIGAETDLAVFSQNEAHNDAVEGASYDRATNTLTLKDFKHPNYTLSTNMMGDDFKLKIEGVCELDAIHIWGDGYGGSLSIEGTGTITVNADKLNEYAIALHAERSDSTLNFGKNVNVTLFAQKNAAIIDMANHEDLSTAITFGDGRYYKTERQKTTYEEYVYEGALEVGEAYESESNYGFKAECKDDTNPNHIYAVNISDGDYWVNRLIYLEEYDAIVMDYSYKYSTRPLTKEEFENSGITLVKENRPEKIYYTNDWNEQYRGTRATKLSCSSDPDGVYVVNFGWIEDREHPTDYFIKRIIWDDDLEYYVIDDTFESLSLDPDEFADSDYEILRNEDGSEKTMYFIDDFFDFKTYAFSDPKVVKDSEPDKMYIAQALYLEENMGKTEPDSYHIRELVYNEKRGYYFEGEIVDEIAYKDFENSGYHFVYTDQNVDCVIKTTGNVQLNAYNIYTDKNGKKYMYDDYTKTVYDYSEDNYKTIGENKFYLPTENKEVNVSDLTPVKEIIDTSFYTYTIDSDEIWYNGGTEPVYSGKTGDCDWKYDKDTKTLTISGKGATDGYDKFLPAPWSAFNVENLVIEDGVEWLRYRAFTGLNIETLTLPDSVKTVGMVAFENCKKLKNINLSKNLESIGGGAFSGCTSLESVNIPDKVTEIGPFAFAGCTNLSNITVADSVYEMGAHAFDNTAWYQNQPDGPVYAGKVLYSYKGKVPENTTLEIRSGTVSTAGGAISDAQDKDNIKDIKIPSSLWMLGENSFYDCKNISGLYIPDTVTRIDESAVGYYYDPQDDKLKKYDNFAITGVRGSNAEKYAKDNGFIFNEKTSSYTVGDVNADGKVNGSDAGLLSRYTSGWSGYEAKIKNMAAADVNGDGRVNGADAGLLARYTSGWKGYDKYIVNK